MKKILLALFSIAGGTMALEASVLIETGKPHAVIVIPAGAAEQLRTDWNKSTYAAYGYAAARLKEYFKEVAGADIPVTNEGVNFSGTPIYLGPCRAVLEAIKKDPALDQKEPEGYSIFPVKNGTAIYGEISNGFDRGILFGVYRFAEKVLGMKWYFPEPDGLGRVIPQKKTLVLDSWREKSAPYFKLRYGLISQAISNREKTGPYLLEGSSLGFWANHTMENWVKRYRDSHPEIFGLNPDGSSSLTNGFSKTGQSLSFLCYAQTNLIDLHLENIEAYDRSGDLGGWGNSFVAPTKEYVMFGPHDTEKVCSCPTCREWLGSGHGTDPFGRRSDYFGRFVSRYAKAIEKKWPGRQLRIIAYQDYEKPPSADIEIPRNVHVTLCLMQSMPTLAKQDAFQNQKQILSSWFERLSRDKSRILLWDYMLWPNQWIDCPVVYPRTLKKWFDDCGHMFSGIFNNGLSHVFAYANPKYQGLDQIQILNFSFFMTWYYSRFWWDPRVDPDYLIAEYCENLFGPASGAMKKFYRLLSHQWEEEPWSFNLEGKYLGNPDVKNIPKIFPPEIVQELRTLLAEGRKACPSGSVEANRLDWMAEKSFNTFFEKYGK